MQICARIGIVEMYLHKSVVYCIGCKEKGSWEGESFYLYINKFLASKRGMLTRERGNLMKD